MMSESHIPTPASGGETSAQPQCSIPQSDEIETCLLVPSESEGLPPRPQVSNLEHDGSDASVHFVMPAIIFDACDDADDSHPQQQGDSPRGISSSSSSRSQTNGQNESYPTHEEGIEKASTPSSSSSSLSSIADALSEVEDENLDVECDVNENTNCVDKDDEQPTSVPPQPTPSSSSTSSALPNCVDDPSVLPPIENNNISTNSNDDDGHNNEMMMMMGSDLDGEPRPRNVSVAPSESEPNEVTVASQATSAAPMRTYPHTPCASISRTWGGLSNTSHIMGRMRAGAPSVVVFVEGFVKEDAITCDGASSPMQESEEETDGGAAYNPSAAAGSSPDAKPAAESIVDRNRDLSGSETVALIECAEAHHVVCDQDQPPQPPEAESSPSAAAPRELDNIGVEPPAVVAPEDLFIALSPLSPTVNTHTCTHNEKEEEGGTRGHHDSQTSELVADEPSASSMTALHKAAVEGAIVEEEFIETVAEEDPSPTQSTHNALPTQTSEDGVAVPSTCDADTPQRCPKAMLSPAAVGVAAGCELLESRLREEAKVLAWDNVLMYSYPTPLAMRQRGNAVSIPSDNVHVHDAATQYSPPPLSEARKHPHHDLEAVDRDTRPPSGVVACLFSSDTTASVTCTSSCRESSCRTCSCDPTPSSQHGESPSETCCSPLGHSVDGQMVHEEPPSEHEGSEDAENDRHLFANMSVSPARASSGSAFGHTYGMGMERHISHDGEEDFAAADYASPVHAHHAQLHGADENAAEDFLTSDYDEGELLDGLDEKREQSHGASAQQAAPAVASRHRPSSPPAKRARAVAFVCASSPDSPATAVPHCEESEPLVSSDESPSFMIRQCDEYDRYDGDEPPYTHSPTMTAMDSIPHDAYAHSSSSHPQYNSHGGRTRAKSEAPASFSRRAKSVAYGLGGGGDEDDGDGYAGPQLTPRTPTLFRESALRPTPPSMSSTRQSGRKPSSPRPAGDIPSASTGDGEDNKGGAGIKACAQDSFTRIYQRLGVFLCALKECLRRAWTISKTLMPAQMLVLLVAFIVLYSTVKISHSAVMELWSPPEEMLLVRNNILTVAELESRYGSGKAIYHPSILRKHYLTVLNKTYTELDELTKVYAPDDDVGLLQVALAYHHSRYRVKLYTRSLDESWLNRRVLYPLRDAYVFGLKRHGLRSAVGHALRGDLYSLVLQRGIDTFVCLAQSEARPCPSVAYASEGYEETFGQRLDWQNVDAMRLFMEWVSHPERLSRDRIRLLLRHYASEGHTVGL